MRIEPRQHLVGTGQWTVNPCKSGCSSAIAAASRVEQQSTLNISESHCCQSTLTWEWVRATLHASSDVGVGVMDHCLARGRKGETVLSSCCLHWQVSIIKSQVSRWVGRYDSISISVSGGEHASDDMYILCVACCVHVNGNHTSSASHLVKEHHCTTLV